MGLARALVPGAHPAAAEQHARRPAGCSTRCTSTCPANWRPKLALGLRPSWRATWRWRARCMSWFRGWTRRMFRRCSDWRDAMSGAGEMQGRGGRVATDPASSALYLRAQVSAARTLLGEGNAAHAGRCTCRVFAGRAFGRWMDGTSTSWRARFFGPRLRRSGDQQNGSDGKRRLVLGRPLAERALRRAWRARYGRWRALPRKDERIRLMDQANLVRPRTLI